MSDYLCNIDVHYLFKLLGFILCVQIANKGLVSFGKRDKGRRLKLKPYKRMICPYLSDIGAWDTDGGKCV